MSDKRIFIISGAGISAESGIPTFRDSNGLWENHRVEDVASPGGFRKDPELVLRFYNERRKDLLAESIKPNPAHWAIGKLYECFPGKVTIVTQNIDDLHERGGAEDVIHMHGELLKKRCSMDENHVSECLEDIHLGDLCSERYSDMPELTCGGQLRPHVVWFEENILHNEEIYAALDELEVGDEFWSIGTSGQVYPASDFVRIAKRNKATTVCFDMKSYVTNRNHFHKIITGPASITVPAYVDKLLDLHFS